MLDILSEKGKNYAVKRDLDDLAKTGRSENPCELTADLYTKYTKYKAHNYEDFTEKVNVGQQIANLTEGKLVPLRHIKTGAIKFVKRDGRWSDNKTVGGKFQFYMTNLASEWISSRPEIDPICPSSQDQIEEFIDDVKVVQDAYHQRFYSIAYEKKEFWEAACFGTWITRYYFDPRTQDIEMELLEFPACRWDTRVLPEQSPYFIYETKIKTGMLENILDVDIDSDDFEGEYDYGLRIIEQISAQGTGVRGQGKDQIYAGWNIDSDETIVTQMWLQPEAYCDIDLMQAEKTVSGATIPKGRSLMKLFPDGMCVVGINGMKHIIGIYAENHKDHIVTGIYHDRLYSGVGKGVDDAVDVYKELNDLYSQALAYTRAHSMPAWGYNKDMVSEADARDIGKGRKNIPFDFSNAPDGVNNINQAIQAIQPTNPGEGAFAFIEKMETDMQNAFQVTAFSEGMPGVNNETATGAEIGQSLAMKQLLPQHLNKADHRIRSAKVYFELFRQFVNEPKWFSVHDKNNVTAGKNLSGHTFGDVPVDFRIVANSETPKTQRGDELSYSRLFQFTGGIEGWWAIQQQDPDFASEIATAFGIRQLSMPKTSDAARVCRKRIEQARKILDQELMTQQMMTMMTGQSVDNVNLASIVVSRLNPPISPDERYVPQKINWLAELLDTDEMQYAPMEMRYIVQEMIRTHKRIALLGQAQDAQDQNLGMVIGNLPMLVGEQAANQSNEMLKAELAQRQAQAQGATQTPNEIDSAQITDTLEQRNHERAMELEGFKQQGQLRLGEVQNQRAKETAKGAT